MISNTLKNLSALLAFSLAAFAQPAIAGPCTDALIGSYAVQPGGKAVLRIEKVKGVMVSRVSDDEGNWSEENHFFTPLSPSELPYLLGDKKDAAQSCGGYADRAGLFIKLPVGAHYPVSSASGKSEVRVASQSGYVVLQASGFATGATEMFKIAQPEQSAPAPAGAADPGAAVSTHISAPVSASPVKTVHDCRDCPSMAVLPAGQFDMGTRNGKLEENPDPATHQQRLHKVKFAKPFAISQTPVTRAQFAAFVAASADYEHDSGCFDVRPMILNQMAVARHDNYPGFAQTDNDPAVCVSWKGANAYAKWLSKKTGKHYRLPSEAEWEYACRAGGSQRYCGSDDLGAAGWYGTTANDEAGNSGLTTHPVAQKPANAWQLYDMSGNVWQMTEDCFTDDNKDAPADGKPVTQAGCEAHVIRGGSWASSPASLEATARSANGNSGEFNHIGFRLVRELP